MSKRRRFLVTSLILSLGFVGIQFLTNQNRFLAIGLLGLLSLVLFAWSLWEGLGRNMTLLTLILPTIFTLGVGIFWFLLPGSIFAQIPVVIFFGVGVYVLCLTMNIYSVSASRTIALLRAARGVGFILTLVTSFLVFDAILSFRSYIWISLPVAIALSLPLFLQGVWSVNLETKFEPKLLLFSAISSLIIGEIVAALYFWPTTIVVGSLFLTVAVYVLLGLGQAKFEERLFSQTIREYLVVGILVFVAIFFATHWG